MIEQADAIEWLNRQEPGSLDLIVSSPPYENRRSYEGLPPRVGQDWVDWMVEVVRASTRACRGLVCFVVEGKTERFRWSATPALLLADLHRAGFNLRKPPIFHRVGIPGSGGPDWWRGDTEWTICVTPPGRLPWSDNTANGHPPKYRPGGPPSHRAMTSGYVRGDTRVMRKVYTPPKLANAGNVVSVSVLPQLIDLWQGIEGVDDDEIVRVLQEAIDSQTTFERGLGIALTVLGAQILRPSVRWRGEGDKSFGDSTGGTGSIPSADGDTNVMLPDLPGDPQLGATSRRRESDKQCDRESASPLSAVPQLSAQKVAWVEVPSVRRDELRKGVLPYALQPMEAAWRSACEMREYATRDSSSRGDLISCKVGGGLMGSPLAHENEAPFPESLVAPFIQCFCPPGGIVADPFAGSGTTMAAALKLGRQFRGCDIRASQVDLATRRLDEVGSI